MEKITQNYGKKSVEKTKPIRIMKKFVDNMNSLPFAKNIQTPNEIVKNSLNSEACKERLYF